MKILDILTSPWAIVPDKLYEIQEIYSTHLRGEKIDIAGIEAKINAVPEDDEKRYQVINNIAVIPIQGVIAKRMNLFGQISGGVSTELVGKDMKTVLADDTIKGIVLDIDSPGGTVDGTQELADIVFAGRDTKPIVAYSDGMIASAAYWIGSAAHEIYISGTLNPVGSIGVVGTHVDYSEYEKKLGIKTTEIYAGKYKRIASEHRPLSKEGKQTLQDQVDYIYSVFVDEVAKHRGKSSDKVLDDMADGRIFIGEQAINAGLVDGVSTFDRLINTRLPVLQSENEKRAALLDLNNSLNK